jgi:hypothetical protein
LPDYPTPHLEKLSAALVNEKLPARDKPRIEAAIERYHQWINDQNSISGTPDRMVEQMIALLNAYKLYVDLELILRFINHVRQLLVNEAPVEKNVLELGYF